MRPAQPVYPQPFKLTIRMEILLHRLSCLARGLHRGQFVNNNSQLQLAKFRLPMDTLDIQLSMRRNQSQKTVQAGRRLPLPARLA